MKKRKPFVVRYYPERSWDTPKGRGFDSYAEAKVFMAKRGFYSARLYARSGKKLIPLD